MKLHENRYALFPVLAAWFSVLSLAAANLGGTGHVEQFGSTLLLATAVGLLAWLFSGVLTRDGDRRTLISLVFIAWFAGYSIVATPLEKVGFAPLLTFVTILAVLLALVAVLVRTTAELSAPARLARTTTVIVLVFPVFTFLSVFAGRWSAARAQDDVYAEARPRASAGSPNVFFIVVDKYSGSRSLLENHGFDNRPFEDRMRSRGFVVPRESRSNYPHTWMSLASILNWTFLDELLDGSTASPLQTLFRAIEDNRAARFFMEQGYEFVFLPTTFSATRSNPFADRQLPQVRRRSGVNVGAAWLDASAAGRAGIWMSGPLVDMLPAGGSRFPYPIETAEEIEAKFDLLADLAAEPGTRFVFAHLLVPHEPYLFHADCSHRPPFWPPTDYVADQEPIRQAYLEQLQCVNRMIENLVDRILETSEVPPILLIQSDHGHAMMAVNPLRGEQLPLDQLGASQVNERTDIFAAYYLPSGGDTVIYDSITPINLLPSVLNHYFDAGIPLQEDAVFWARLHPPFEFTRLR
jgi:hypothetical protein